MVAPHIAFGYEIEVGQQVDQESTDQIGAVTADPAWLPYRVRDGGRMLKLIRLPRSALGALSFIDNRSHPSVEIGNRKRAPRRIVSGGNRRLPADRGSGLSLHFPFCVLLFNLDGASTGC